MAGVQNTTIKFLDLPRLEQVVDPDYVVIPGVTLAEASIMGGGTVPPNSDVGVTLGQVLSHIPQRYHGKSAYQVAVENGFDGTESDWLNSLIGPSGKSAYGIAVQEGFVGTESEWLESLVGPRGLSAYEVAVAAGFSGNQSEWLASLIGPTGKSAYELSVEEGFQGTISEWLLSLVGAAGASAYEVAVNNGFQGTESEWLVSLKGRDGTSVKILGTLGSTDDLPEGAENGDGYIVGEDFWVWSQPTSEWVNVGRISGPEGKSAYEVAVANGFVGTQSQWLVSLKGADGIDGVAGNDGLSAYQVAVNNGFEGTEADWLASLEGAPGVGVQGKSAYDVAVDGGYVGDQASWLNSLKGEPGKSAYAAAVDRGFVGTEEDWLNSLQGANGKSAYELAVDNGFVGTLQEWLDSLHGTNGLSAYEIALNNGFVGTEAEWLESLNGADGSNGASGNIPTDTQDTAYTFTVADVGRCKSTANSGIRDYTIPKDTFSRGDTYYVLNEYTGMTASDYTAVKAAAGVTLRRFGQTTTGTANVYGLGFATIFFLSPNVAVISGPGVG